MANELKAVVAKFKDKAETFYKDRNKENAEELFKVNKELEEKIAEIEQKINETQVQSEKNKLKNEKNNVMDMMNNKGIPLGKNMTIKKDRLISMANNQILNEENKEKKNEQITNFQKEKKQREEREARARINNITEEENKKKNRTFKDMYTKGSQYAKIEGGHTITSNSILKLLNNIASKIPGSRKKFDENSKYEDIVKFFKENTKELNKYKFKKEIGGYISNIEIPLGDLTNDFLKALNTVQEVTIVGQDSETYKTFQTFYGNLKNLKNYVKKIKPEPEPKPGPNPNPEPEIRSIPPKLEIKSGLEIEVKPEPNVDEYVLHSEYDEYTKKTDDEIEKLKEEINKLKEITLNNNININNIELLINNGILDEESKKQLTIILNEGDINISEGSKFYNQIKGIVDIEIENKLKNLEEKLNEKIQKNTNRIQKLEEKFSTIENNNITTKEDVNNRLDSLKEEFTTIQQFNKFKLTINEKLNEIKNNNNNKTLNNEQIEVIKSLINVQLAIQKTEIINDIDILKNERIQIKNELNNLKNKVNQHDTDINNLKEQLKLQQEQIDEFNEFRTQIQSGNITFSEDTINNIVNNLNVSAEFKEQIIDATKQQIINDNEFINQISDAVEQKIQITLNQQNETINEIENKLNEHIENYNQEIISVKQQQEDFNIRIENCEDNIEDLRSTLDSEISYFQERIDLGDAITQSRLDLMQQQINLLQKTRDSLTPKQRKEEIEEIASDLIDEFKKMNEYYINKLEVEQTKIKKQLININTRLDTHKKRLDEHDKKLIDLEKSKDNYEKRFDSLVEMMTKIQEENEKLKKRVEILEKNDKKQDEEINSLDERKQDKIQKRDIAADIDPNGPTDPVNPKDDPQKPTPPKPVSPKENIKPNRTIFGSVDDNINIPGQPKPNDNITRFGSSDKGSGKNDVKNGNGTPIELSDEDKIKHLSNLYYLAGTSNQYNESEVKTGLAVANILNARSNGKGADGIVPTLTKLSESLAEKILKNEIDADGIATLGGFSNDNKLTEIINKYQNGIETAENNKEKIETFKETLKNELYGYFDLEFINKANNIYKENNQEKENEFLENFYKNVSNASSYLQQTTINNNIEIPNTSKVKFVKEDKTINSDSLKFIQDSINNSINEENVKKDFEIDTFEGNKEQFESAKKAVIHTERTKNQFDIKKDENGKVTEVEGIKNDLTNDKATVGLKYPNDFSKEYMDTITKSNNYIDVKFKQDNKRLDALNNKDDIQRIYNLDNEDSVEILNFNGTEVVIPTKMLDFVELNNGIGRNRGTLPAVLGHMRKAAILNGGNPEEINKLITIEIDGQRMTVADALEKTTNSKIIQEALGVLCNSMGPVGNDGKTPKGIFSKDDEKEINEMLSGGKENIMAQAMRTYQSSKLQRELQ